LYDLSLTLLIELGVKSLLSPRLKALAMEVPIGARLADIGTDHGLVPAYLAKNQIVAKAIATDISEGALQKAKDVIKLERFDDIIETRLGPGLEVIEPGEVDTIIIAGMGGKLITEILNDGKDVLRYSTRLILQPMNAQQLVRRWLIEQGYKITNERLVKDGKYIYEIIVAEEGFQEKVDDIQYEIGFKLNKDPLFKEFIGIKISKTEAIIKELQNQNTEKAKIRKEQLLEKLKKYKEAYRCFVQLED